MARVPGRTLRCVMSGPRASERINSREVDTAVDAAVFFGRCVPLMQQAPHDFTELLRAHAAGDTAAIDRLFPQVYDELRRIARGRLRHERADHTLGATELVHEAFFRLVRLDRIDWRGRAHFLAIASRAMRNVLLDHAERRDAGKRGGGARAVTIERIPLANEAQAEELIELCEALARLELLEPRQARVVECRFFAGLSLDETAAALGISAATVSRDWTVARAWLHSQLTHATGEPAGGVNGRVVGGARAGR